MLKTISNNGQKGSVVLIIALIIVIILVLVGGDIWYLKAHNNSSSLSAAQNTTDISVPSRRPSGAFDQPLYTITSLSSNYALTLNGIAENIPYVRIAVTYGYFDTANESDIVPVVNNRWSATLLPYGGNNDLGAFGTSTVSLYGYYSDYANTPIPQPADALTPQPSDPLLATTSVDFVLMQSTHPLAAFDKGTLNQIFVEDGSPTLTGTASGTNAVKVYIAGFTQYGQASTVTGYQSFGYVIPINGHWSKALPNSNVQWFPGAYPIELRDASGIDVLASGTLIITSLQTP